MLNGIHLMFHVEGGKLAAQVGRLSTGWRCGDCMISSGVGHLFLEFLTLVPRAEARGWGTGFLCSQHR